MALLCLPQKWPARVIIETISERIEKEVEFPKGEGASAELGSLKRFKDDVKEVNNNMECGITIKNYNDLKVGDIVEAYEEEEVKRTL